MSVGGTFGVTGTSSLAATAFSVSPTMPTPTTGDNTTKGATTAFVNASITANPGVLAGSLLMWPTASAPTGYLNCDGTAVSRTTYAALFAVVSTTFGTGDGSTTFNLPNYTNRMPYGTTVGATGGSATTTISQANLPNVSFPVTDPGHAHSYTTPSLSPNNAAGSIPDYIRTTGATTGTATTGISVNSGGSGTAATTISPYLGINFIIKT